MPTTNSAAELGDVSGLATAGLGYFFEAALQESHHKSWLVLDHEAIARNVGESRCCYPHMQRQERPPNAKKSDQQGHLQSMASRVVIVDGFTCERPTLWPTVRQRAGGLRPFCVLAAVCRHKNMEPVVCTCIFQRAGPHGSKQSLPPRCPAEPSPRRPGRLLARLTYVSP